MLMRIKPESVTKTLTNEVVIDFGNDEKKPTKIKKKLMTIDLYMSIKL